MSESGEHGEPVRLLMEHRSSLFAFILAIVRDYDTAEDVLQEVSVAVCEASDQFRPGTNFGAWAREIARRRVLANHRAAARFPSSMTDEDLQRLEAGFERADSQASAKQRIDALRYCLETLTQAARRVLQLRFACRFSHREIAEQVDRQPESVRKSIYRSRQALRTCIERRLSAGGSEA
jgi:RNA polymerase sigma-70 factor (ECF subfamily)